MAFWQHRWLLDKSDLESANWTLFWTELLQLGNKLKITWIWNWILESDILPKKLYTKINLGMNFEFNSVHFGIEINKCLRLTQKFFESKKWAGLWIYKINFTKNDYFWLKHYLIYRPERKIWEHFFYNFQKFLTFVDFYTKMYIIKF